jgi:hypothetical protein
VSENNNLTNIKNVLGFLLAGFGAILSFLGIRSSEVSTILRNNSPQASLIALILVFGVLAAVSAITIDSIKKVNIASAVAIGIVLFGLGALVNFAIPIGPNLFTIDGVISLAIGCLLVVGGTTALLRYRPFWIQRGGEVRTPIGTLLPGADEASGHRTVRSNDDEDKRKLRKLWLNSAARRPVDLIDLLILASVVLTATAAYGAVRLESKSQLSFSSQVGASFSTNGPLTTVSIDIAATKIPQADWIYVYIFAVPVKGINLTIMCKNGGPKSNINHCITDPCGTYFGDQLDVCNVLLNGTIVPNASGDVDETLSVPFLTAKFQDVDVRAEVCSANANERCEASVTGQNSRLDWIISTTRGMPDGG